MKLRKIKVVLGYDDRYVNVRYGNEWLNSRFGVKIEPVVGTEDKNGIPQWAVDYSDLYNGNVHLYGLYSRMFLSTLEQHINVIEDTIYNKVYGDYHVATKVTYKCNNKEYYRMNYNRDDARVGVNLRRQLSITVDKNSLANYQFMDNGYDCTYHGYGYELFSDDYYVAEPVSQEFKIHHGFDELDNVLNKKIKYNKILGLSDEKCAKSISKMGTIHVTHLRDANTFNNQLSTVRRILSCNAEKVELDSENSEMSLGYDHQIVVKYDRAKCYHVNIEMPEAYEPLIKNWLKHDDIIHVSFTKTGNTKCKYISINDHMATALPGVKVPKATKKKNSNEESPEGNKASAVEMIVKDMVLDPFITVFNKDRINDPKYKRALNNSVYNYYPESKNEWDPLRNYEIDVEYMPSESMPLDKWLNQFIAPEILESIKYKSDEDYNKDVLELLKYSVGVEDTMLVLNGKLDYMMRTIVSTQEHLTELGYAGKIYFKLDKDQRLKGEGISKRKSGLSYDSEDDDDTDGNLYAYQNDQDDLYDMYEDNYIVINGNEYLVFEIK